MTGSRARWKLWVKVTLGVLLALDASLAVARWRLSVAASQQQLQFQEVNLRTQVAALEQQVARAEKVRGEIPQIQQQCNSFYQDEMLGPSQGYAALVTDLDGIAHSAGLVISGVQFSQKNASAHGVTEVDASPVIEGNYGALLRFIGGLERSKTFYVLDSLELASSAGGQVKLNIRLHTYIRT